MANEKKKFNPNDRVRRVSGNGSHGTVKELREEASAAMSADSRALMVTVQWDNGTFSYFGPESLELVAA